MGEKCGLESFPVSVCPGDQEFCSERDTPTPPLFVFSLPLDGRWMPLHWLARDVKKTPDAS